MAKEKKKDPKPKETVEIPVKELEMLKSKHLEAEDLAKRMKADFENLKKQVEKDRASYCDFAHSIFMSKLLPVLDSFEQALKGDVDKKGLEVLYNQFIDILKKEGLKELDALGKKFDPYKHEILMQGESDQDEDTIIEVFQKGFLFKDKVLRHTKVKVSKPAPKKDTENETDKEDSK